MAMKKCPKCEGTGNSTSRKGRLQNCPVCDGDGFVEGK